MLRFTHVSPEKQELAETYKRDYKLTNTESIILVTLLVKSKETVTHKELIESLGYNPRILFEQNKNIISVYISKLRKKGWDIKTVRKKGLKLNGRIL